MSDKKRIVRCLLVIVAWGFLMWLTDEPEAMKDMSVKAGRVP
jgi:hypothetical protein